MLQRFFESLFLVVALVPTGFILQKKLFRQTDASLLGSLLVSYFFLTSLLTAMAFFTPLNNWFLAGYIIVSLSLIIVNRDTRHFLLQNNIVHFSVALLFTSMVGSFAVKLPDEASYYLQTIYALQQDGWIKGIVNLEPRFALGSSFHVFASITALPDGGSLKLNVLILALVIYTGFSRIRERNTRGALYWFLIVILGFPIYFLLIPSQSPDIMGWVITALILENLFISRNQDLQFAALLLGTAILLKTNVLLTCFILAITFIVTTKKRYKLRTLIASALLISIPGLLLVIKNIWLTGYPLYPLPVLAVETNWTTPVYALHNALAVLKAGDTPLFEKMNLYLIIVMGVVLVAIIIVLRKRLRSIPGSSSLLIATLLIFGVWAFTILNLRLASHFLIPITAFFLSGILRIQEPEKLKKIFSVSVLAASIILLLMPSIDLSKWLPNSAYNNIDGLNSVNILFPKPPDYPSGYCGNAPFPCVTFKLYPEHETWYEQDGNYYYLKLSGNH